MNGYNTDMLVQTMHTSSGDGWGSSNISYQPASVTQPTTGLNNCNNSYQLEPSRSRLSQQLGRLEFVHVAPDLTNAYGDQLQLGLHGRRKFRRLSVVSDIYLDQPNIAYGGMLIVNDLN